MLVSSVDDVLQILSCDRRRPYSYPAMPEPVEKSTEPHATPSRRAGKVLNFLTLLYLLMVVVLCPLIRIIGERNWFLSILLYLPPTVWLLPSFLLAIFSAV